MPDLLLVLAVLVTALALVAVVGLVLAHRAVAPVARVGAVAASELSSMRLAVRTAAVRGAIALLAAVVALIGSVWTANSVLREAVGDGVFAAPLLGGAVGVGAYALLQSRPLIERPGSAASLDARRTTGFAQVRSFAAVGALVALLLALILFATIATPAVAAFVGPRLVALLVLLVVLAVITVLALRGIAERAALPPRLHEVDVAIRRIATRFVLLLTTSALLAPISLVALQSGGWLWGFAAVDPAAAPVGLALGAVVTVLGALAGIAALASAIAVVVATVEQLRSTGRLAVASVTVRT